MENRIELWVSPTGNVAVYRGNAFIPTERLTEEERLFVLNRVCDELKGKIDLEAEIKKYTENLYNETFGNGQGTLDEFDWEDIATVIEETARHFAQRGAEHAKKDEIPVPADLEEAAKEYAKTTFKKPYSDNPDEEVTIVEPDKYAGFISGAKWQAEQLLKSSPMPEDTVLFNKGVEEGRRMAEEEQADLFTIVALDAAQRAKEQMMKDIPKWHKVRRGSCFDKHTNFLLSAREGHFYCSSIEVPRDGYILLVDELERLPKEDEK